MGFLGAADGWREQKGSSSLNFSHISYNDEIWHSYNLRKEDQKIHESLDAPLEFC